MTDMRRNTGSGVVALAAGVVLVACGEEPPPTSVMEFMENPILLEATMVRCVENRAEARYDAECLNAREAVDRIAVREEEARRAELEAQSERKRQALRRAQEAAAEARRRSLEEARRREEAELLGPFATLPEGTTRPEPDGPADEPPVDPTPPEPAEEEPLPEASQPAEEDNAAPADETQDLEAIRRELERRQNESDQPREQ